MLEAYKLMTKNVVTVDPNESITRAAELLIKHKISGTPVTDQDGRLVGILSEKDILRLLIETDPKKNKVSDFMTKDVISFKETDSIIAICEFLIGSNVRRVPIVSGEKLVGVISRRDIIGEIIKLRDRIE